MVGALDLTTAVLTTDFTDKIGYQKFREYRLFTGRVTRG
jgi:hypothetical protein